MNQPICNDQAYIAESFRLNESFTAETARLTSFKINSYKLSLMKSSFRSTREELEVNIRRNLLNFTAPEIILADQGFFSSPYEN